MKKRKLIAMLLFVCMLIPSLASCGTNDPGTSAPGTSGPGTSDQTSADEAIDISGLTEEQIAEYKAMPLVVYTNSGSGGRADWWTKKAKEAGFTNITIVNGGASAMAEKIKAERENPQADVMCGLNAMGWTSLKREGLLVKFVPSWADLVDEGLNDPDGYYHGICKEATLLVYDKNVWTEDEAPKDWLDLWQDENTQYHGTFQCWSALTGGTTQSNLTGILHRYKSDAEDALYGVSPEGWEQIKKLYTYGVSAEGDVISAIAATTGSQQNVHCGQWYSSGIKSYSETYEVELGYHIYLLSNTSARFHSFRKNIPALRFFDGEFISADHHLLKPESEIYRCFLEKFHLAGAECLFIDDTPSNVEAAIRCGLRGVVYHGDPCLLRRQLKQLDVDVAES